MTTRPIDGEIEGIERAYGKTEVMVNGPSAVSSYALTEELIEFGTAVDDDDLVRAMDILESMELSPQSEAMWRQLHDVGLGRWELLVAERCAAAVGDVARVFYLQEMRQLWEGSERSGAEPRNDWRLRAKMFQLKKDLPKAEAVYLAHNRVEEAIAMYEDLRMWPDAIRVAERKNQADAPAKKKRYYDWLIKTGQEEKAASIKEAEGDPVQAVNLYMTAGLPLAAARVLSDHGIVQPSSLLENVGRTLEEAGMHSKAGNVYGSMGNRPRALECFIQGKAFRQAVELARSHFPDRVVSLEESWGDHLASIGQVDIAIDHYMEAHALHKAVDAAIRAQRFNKAVAISEQVDPSAADQDHLTQLARHFASAKKYDEAERFFTRAGMFNDAVHMYADAGMWERAKTAAESLLSGPEITAFYLEQARGFQAKGKLVEAERLFLEADEIGSAIDMYKNHRDFERLVQLVSDHRADSLDETCLYVAKELEKEGQLLEAENYYARYKNWLGAVNMYRSHDMWEEAIRVARYLGGQDAIPRVAYAYALHLGEGAEATKVLSKMKLLGYAIEYAIESGNFDHAFDLAENGSPDKIADIHLKLGEF